MSWSAYRPDGGQNLVHLADLLGALSHALDLTEGQPPGHSLRSAWIALEVARELALPADVTAELAYSVLLKDLGCSSNAARICSLYLTDDLTFKRDFKTIGHGLPAALRFVAAHTGLGAALVQRIRTLTQVIGKGTEIAHELIETRCTRGAAIARRLRFSTAVARGIAELDEHFDGGGRPSGLAGHEIHLFARVALACQVADVFNSTEGSQAARRELLTRRGGWFDPVVVDAFLAASADGALFADLADPDLDRRFTERVERHGVRMADEAYLDEIADAFADVVDAKSPFTSGHSRRVAAFAADIARALGLEEGHVRWIRRAGLLHDIGKLGVSNAILDKPGRPTDAEWTALRRHAALTEEILGRIRAFRDLAPVAAAHHERLDGKGYPLGLAGPQLALESRILAVADVFDALTADRPYRAAMAISEALAIMERDRGTAFDPDCLDALVASINARGRIDAHVA